MCPYTHECGTETKKRKTDTDPEIVAHSDPSGSRAGAKSGRLAQTTTQPAETQSSVCLSVCTTHWLTVCLCLHTASCQARRGHRPGLPGAGRGGHVRSRSSPLQRGKSGLPPGLFMTDNCTLRRDWRLVIPEPKSWRPGTAALVAMLPLRPTHPPQTPTRPLQPCTSVYLFTWCPVEQSRWGTTFWSLIWKLLLSSMENTESIHSSRWIN